MGKIFAWVGGIASVIAVLVSMVWGVPYYVDIKVEERLKQLQEAAGQPQEVTQLQSDVSAIKEDINDMQGDVAAIRADNAEFKTIFIEYLQGQAN